MPRVTAIISTYNRSGVLRCAIASVLGQTFTDLELLVVGDACTDDSAQIVTTFSDSRIRWINLPTNSGHQSAPNNEGLRQANGEFIAYLGHDDLWLPQHLQACVTALDRTGADLAYALVACVAPHGGAVWPSIPRPARGLFSPPAGIVHRRSMTTRIGGWRDYRELRQTPDVELWRRARAARCRFVAVPRLTAVKFPASWRAGVYRENPSHEQEAWLARIQQEPQLEAEELAKAIVAEQPNAVSYVALLQQVARETWRRVNGARGFQFRRGQNIAALRAYKGLRED